MVNLRTSAAIAAIPVLLAACAPTKDARLLERCRDLVSRNLVSPTAANYLDNRVFRRVQARFRVPDGMPDLQQIEADLNDVEFEIKAAEIRGDNRDIARLKKRIAGISERRELAGRLLKDMANKPWAEILLEVDAVNRSGVTIRMLGVCTFQDTGDPRAMDATFRLSSLEEGRIPLEPPTPFSVEIED